MLIEFGLLFFLGLLIMGIMGLVVGKLFDKYGICLLVIIGLVIMTYVIYEFIKLLMDMLYSVIMMDYIICLIGMLFIMMLIMIVGMNVLLMKLIFYGIVM